MVAVDKQAEMAARREKWRGIVRGAEASGLSVRAYCKQHEVDLSQFYYWRRVLQAQGRSEAADQTLGHSLATKLSWLAAVAIALLTPSTLPAQSATVNLTDPAFIAKGAGQFAKTCAVGYCHGSEGLPARGPGLRGRRWDTQKLYSQVHDGIPNTTMPAWKSILPETEIWLLRERVSSLSEPTRREGWRISSLQN
jgi:mono/diheme cytochrome c family protein